MSAILPRSQKKKNPEKLSHSSKEANKGKKSFQGTGNFQRSSGRKQEVQTLQSHPWSGFVEKLLSPLPPDIRYSIQRALGGFAEAVGKMFPNQNTEMTSNLFADRSISFSSWTEDQQGTEEDIQQLLSSLQQCRNSSELTAPYIRHPYNIDSGMWAKLVKSNDKLNLTIRYSRQTEFNKEQLNKELTEKPENALFDFWQVKNQLAVVRYPWLGFARNEPVVVNNAVFFQSDTSGLNPPFLWRDQESFRTHLNVVTKCILRRVDFNHACLAGHSVLSLLQLPPRRDFPLDGLPEYFKVDELDIYIHGDFETEEERVELATETVRGILLCCSEIEQAEESEMLPAVEKLSTKLRIVIPGMPVINVFPAYKPDTFDANEPFPPLSVAQLLHSFEIDSYCFAYDGSRIVTTLRGIRAACSRTNIANPIYKSSSKYEDRLVECRRRGYTIGVPNADLRHVHRCEGNFLEHSIDIPRLYSLCYPEDKGGGQLPVIKKPRELYPFEIRERRGTLGKMWEDIKFMLEPLW